MNSSDQPNIVCQSIDALQTDDLILSPEEYNNILDMQQAIFKLLTVGHNSQEILSSLCLLAEKLLPNSVASIMLKDPQTNLLNVVCAPSIPEVGHTALAGLKPGPGGGSCGNAVYHNEPQFVSDTKTDDRWQDIRHIAYDFNLCACWSMPIHDHDKKAVGSFALSSFEHRSPSLFHKYLLENCAFIVSIVLKRNEYESQISSTQHQLQILGTAIKYASDGVIITDKDNKIIEVNQAFIKSFGYRFEEVMGKNPNILSSGRHDQQYYQKMWNEILDNGHWNGEIWNKRSNGEIFPEWMSVTAIYNDKKEIQNYLAIFNDRSTFYEQQHKLLSMAYQDQLTELPNRQQIIMDLESESPYACAIFNIDDFKEINDFFGINAGDDVLKQIAKWFLEMKQSAYRIGGDEFAILIFDQMTPESFQHKISTLISLIEEKTFYIGDETLNIRTTVGAAIGHERLMTHADIALHTAKEQKTSFALYEENQTIEETYRKNFAIAAEIRTAIVDQRIQCHYQPIFNFSNETIDKYETLVRMVDSKGNLMSPAEFLPIAKKTKMYPQITREVVYQACNLFKNRHESFSINLSDSDIRNSATVSSIFDTITSTGTAPRIVFEILESEGIENFKEVSSFITRAKALGAKIAIDDFGTGYSNFENILRLDVDYIKIDGSLIRGLDTDPMHSLIVSSIVDFALKIGAKTIAEFVSDEAIYDVVKELGIDYAQGYYTGKPAPIM